MSTPSLLNIPYLYKAGTLYSQIPESGAGDFTVQRTTTVANRSTRINKDGFIETVLDNVPRLDYPLGGAVNGCPALLVEPSATNLFQRSEEFNNAYWTPSNVTPTPNSTGTLDPFGGNNAELITKTSAINTVAGISRSAPFSATGTHTLSVFIKSSVGNSVLLRMDSVNNTANTAFTFSTKTFSNSGANFISSSFQEFSNGWFRLSLTASVQSTVWSVDVIQLFSNPTNDAFWIFGAQLEANSVPTSYIPTTTAAVTRSGEIITDTTATALIGQQSGTIYCEFQFNTPTVSTAGLLSVESTNNQNRILLWHNLTNNALGVQLKANNSNVFNAPIGTLTNGQIYKIAIGYSSGNTKVYLNGNSTAVITNTSAYTMAAALSRICLGNYENSASLVTVSRIRSFALYAERLTDAEMIALTTL